MFLNATALFVVIRVLFGDKLQTGYHYMIAGNDIYLGEVGLSVLVLAGVALLFIYAKGFLQRLLTVLAVALFAGTLAVTVLCAPHVSPEALVSFGSGGVSKGFAIFTIVILAPWAFVGFDATSFDTAHYNLEAATRCCSLLT